MVVIRDVFQLEFGKAREGVALLREGMEALRAQGYGVERLLTDLTGSYYTLIMESRYPSLSAFEEAIERTGDGGAWPDIYARFVPLVREGHREVLREVVPG